MRRTVIFDYLEMACHGAKPAEIAEKYGVTPRHVADRLILAARKIGRSGFWKFHVSSMDDLYGKAGMLLQRLEVAFCKIDEARDSGSKKYIGKPCQYGHSGLRYVSNHSCVECAYEAVYARIARRAAA